MDSPLSITEIRLVCSLLTKKTDDELSIILGKPVSAIQQQVNLMIGVGKRPECYKKSKIAREAGNQTIYKNQAVNKARKRERESASVRKNNTEKKFQTRKIDLTSCIAVRLSSKTVAYVKPGTDIEKLKQQLNIN